MRFRTVSIPAATALAVTLGLSGGASAATLYTTGAHTTQVAVGATAGATNTTPLVFTSATSPLNTCSNSTWGLRVDQNSVGTVIATVTSGTFTNCSPLPFSATFATPWKLTVSGSPTTAGGVTSWAASLANVAYDQGGGLYHGSLTTGVTARQTGAGGATCLAFNDAGTLTGPLSSNLRWDVTYCFEGVASTWSLT
jgi:hypothetical protein